MQESLPYLIPCESCGHHFNDFIKNYSDEYWINSDKLSLFFLNAHNSVNKKIDPNEVIFLQGYAGWEEDQLKEELERFAETPDVCFK